MAHDGTTLLLSARTAALLSCPAEGDQYGRRVLLLLAALGVRTAAYAGTADKLLRGHCCLY